VRISLVESTVAKNRTIDETTLGRYDRMIAVLQRSVMIALKYGSKAMAVTSNKKPKSKGSFIVTSSAAALSPAWADVTYTTAKTAVIGLVRSAAYHLSSSNILVNAIAPGAFKSSLQVTSDEAREGKNYTITKTSEEIRKEHEEFCRKIGFDDGYYFHNESGEPAEIANIGVFLASDASLPINGATIAADRGKSAAGFGEGLRGRVPPVTPFEID
jgi:NAD(P)-dependent dehydrogenase (short-subunit alcohol dehydrogenase family)